MRLNYAFLVAVLAPVAAVGCYNPGDLGNIPFTCTKDFDKCPDGYTCQVNKCWDNTPGASHRCCIRDTSMAPALTIPKAGTYTTPHVDPGLNWDFSSMTGNCPDRKLTPAVEPNDTIATATKNYDTGALQQNLSICPAGDIDVFQIDVFQQYVQIVVKYEIKKGDLAVGLFDLGGTLLQSDPNYLVDDACIAYSKKVTGAYYAVVTGAKSTDQNRYSITVNKSDTTPFVCGALPMPDLSMRPDLSL